MKYHCAVMDDGGESNARCTVCNGRCGWRRHVNNTYYFELYTEWKDTTLNELKTKYDAAKKGKAKVKDLVREIQRRLTQMDELVMSMIGQVQNSLARLDEIALKPNPLSELEYIDLMIKSEERRHDEGWNERVQYLQAAKEKAQIKAGIKPKNHKATNHESIWTQVKSWWPEQKMSC